MGAKTETGNETLHGRLETRMAAEIDPRKPGFFKLLWELHLRVTKLSIYRWFLLKYMPLWLISVLGSIATLIVCKVFAGDLELFMEHGFDFALLDDEVIIALVLSGILMAAGKLMGFFMGLVVEGIKGEFACANSLSVVAKVFQLPHDKMISTPTGEFGQLLGKCFQLDGIVPLLYTDFLPAFGQMLCGTLFLLSAYGWIGIFPLLMFFSFSVLGYWLARSKAGKAQNNMKALIAEWGKLLAVAQSYEVAHYFGNVDHEVKTAEEIFARMSEGIKKFTAVEWSVLATKIIAIITTGIGVGVLLSVKRGDTNFIEVMALAGYFGTFTFSMIGYVEKIGSLRKWLSEYEVLHEFQSRKSDTADIPSAIELPHPGLDSALPTIEFRGVSFSYGGKEILKDVSFKIEGGQTLGLAGCSGCGKSTIIRLILRFYVPTEGTILINGHDIQSVTATSLRRLFSVVSQDPHLRSATVRENIQYGRLSATEEEIVHAAKRAELKLEDLMGEVENGQVQGLDKECGEGGQKLSGGQQQRVSLARALLKNGSCFILDEPTTALDNVVAKSLQETLDGLRGKNTTLMITHTLEDLKNADLILYLEEGEVKERGDFKELLNLQNGKFASQVCAGRKD